MKKRARNNQENEELRKWEEKPTYKGIKRNEKKTEIKKTDWEEK